MYSRDEDTTYIMAKDYKMVRLDEETHGALDDLKVHHRETFDDVIRRLIRDSNKDYDPNRQKAN